MKKFTKVSLIFAGIFAALGIACWIAGLVLGVTWQEIRYSLEEGEFSIGSRFYNHWEDDSDEGWTASGREYEFSADEVKKLNIDVSYATIEIQESENETIYIKTADNGRDKVNLNGDTLDIKSKGDKNDEHTVFLFLPAGISFEKMNIDISAGTAVADTLTAERIEIEIGAGTLDFNFLDAYKIDIKVGAGTVNGMLAGSQEDYRMELECAVGSMTVGDVKYAGLAHKETINDHGNTERKLEAECGAGEVNLEFEN